MSFVDVTEYVDLRPVVRSADEILASARQSVAVRFPGFQWVEGSLVTAVLEGCAQIVAEAGYQASQLPQVMFQLLGAVYGVQVDLGAPATVDLTVTIAGVAGGTVASGTIFELATVDGPVQFATTAPLTIVGPATTGTVAAQCTRVGTQSNLIPIGTAGRPVLSAPLVTSAVTASISGGGRDEESSNAYLARVVSRLNRLNDSLVLAEHFRDAALDDPLVERALVISNYNGTIGGGPPYNQPGNVTVVVFGAGIVLPAPAKAALVASLQARATVALSVHVVDPNITTVAVTASVKAKPGALLATVQAACVAALTAYLSPLSWPWAGVVRVNELIALLDTVTGVDYVVSLTLPAGDVTVTGDGPLVQAGTLTITVT
jgi:uncharacterized phage protein gp47/JayE